MQSFVGGVASSCILWFMAVNVVLFGGALELVDAKFELDFSNACTPVREKNMDTVFSTRFKTSHVQSECDDERVRVRVQGYRFMMRRMDRTLDEFGRETSKLLPHLQSITYTSPTSDTVASFDVAV